MPILYYLIFSHFVADYLLQPNWLARFKKGSFWGVLIHILLVWLTMGIVLIPYLYAVEIWYAIFAITLVHLGVDYGKLQMKERYPKKDARWFYFIDQLLHIGFIVFIGLHAVNGIDPQALPEAVAKWYANAPLAIYAIGLILVTYTYDVTQYVVKDQKHHLDYERDYYGMIFRGSIWSVLFVVGMIVAK